jgi:two-component system, LuxR family, response regulator FixJ
MQLSGNKDALKRIQSPDFGRVQAPCSGAVGSKVAVAKRSKEQIEFGLVIDPAAQEELCEYNQVYVIDDDIEVRRSLHFLLSTIGFVSWPFACASDFLDNLPSLQPAPILLDIRMPDIDGIQLMRILSDRGINWPTIVITAHAGIPTAVQATKLGAIDYFEKPFDFLELKCSVRSAIEQLATIRRANETKENARRLLSALSPREMEVLVLLVEGLSNKAAAYRLSLSVRTVEMHRANALHKLGIQRVAEAVLLLHEGRITLAPHH